MPIFTMMISPFAATSLALSMLPVGVWTSLAPQAVPARATISAQSASSAMLTTRLMQMPPSLLVAATGGPRGRRVLRRPASLSVQWTPSFSDSRDEDVWALQPRQVPELLDRVDADAEQLGDAELGHHRVGLAGVQVGVVEDPAQALLPPDLLHGVAVAEVAGRAAELPGDVLLGFLQAHPAGHLHPRDQVSGRADPAHTRGERVSDVHSPGVTRAHETRHELVCRLLLEKKYPTPTDEA